MLSNVRIVQIQIQFYFILCRVCASASLHKGHNKINKYTTNTHAQWKRGEFLLKKWKSFDNLTSHLSYMKTTQSNRHQTKDEHWKMLKSKSIHNSHINVEWQCVCSIDGMWDLFLVALRGLYSHINVCVSINGKRQTWTNKHFKCRQSNYTNIQSISVNNCHQNTVKLIYMMLYWPKKDAMDWNWYIAFHQFITQRGPLSMALRLSIYCWWNYYSIIDGVWHILAALKCDR